MVRIGEVAPGTIADELSLQIGSRIVRINGAPVRDSVDFRFLESDGNLELEIVAPGDVTAVVYEIEKDAGESLGIVPQPDTVRQCANKCVFCFIDGNPPDARSRLFLKDDDFRLSFSYGNYVTLTNLGPRGFQRLIEQRLSPLYVSVHATEPDVRERLLGVPMGGDIVERLRELVSQGIEVHAQVVLCPGWNDGAHLDRTLDDLWELGPGVLSVSIVPVGLTRYNLNRPVRLLRPAEARQAAQQVERARRRAARKRGLGWAYAADELFFAAGLPLPDAAYYDDWPLTENGVGAVRRFLDDFDAGLAGLGTLHAGRVAILTGTRMAPLIRPLAPRLEQATGAHFDVVAVINTMFGETVTTAGLLPGRAVQAALQGREVDAALLPAEALNDDGVFIDDLGLDELRHAAADIELRPGHALTGALTGL